MLDATVEIDPVGLFLLGFSIDLELTSLRELNPPKFSLEGFAVAFDQPPLTTAGIFRHGETTGIEYYAGGADY